MRKYVLTLLLLCLHGLARGQTEGYSCYYWFDEDHASLCTVTSLTDRWQMIADASGLSESLHTIHLLVRDGEGRQSNPMTQLFMHTTEMSEQSVAYYWFDNQQGKPQTSPMLQGSFDVDASALVDGIHTFHYLVAKNDGSISSPTVNYFLKATNAASLGRPTCLCLVDGKLVHQELLTAEGGAIHWNLDMSDIADGLHLLQVEAQTANGALAGSRHSYFVKMPKTDATIKGYYWFDTQTDVHEVAVTNGTFEVDASSLTDGFHRFHYQALHSNGTTSMPKASFFLKTAQVNADDELNCICTVDGQLRHIEKLSQQGGIIHWDLDMHDLTDGLHRIQLQTVTPSGAMSGSYTSYFMRVTTPEELGEMRCVYAIDDEAFNTNASVVSNNGSYHFDLDLSELSDGLHHISYMLYNNRGTNTKIQTRFFLKVPLGGNGIDQYQYWLNDEGIETAKTVTLPQKVNPLQLMSLLPVESRPLRSSQFHFDTSSGKPMVYAKNTIHLRFYDAAMRFTDAAKDYADYSIGQAVKVIKTLESGVRETTEWPEENEIKWYQVTAERGDSLRFKLDHAATLQLFAPSGKEIYNVSGAESVNWGGLHVAENGVFYVALHDVTATQGDDISIDYEHIDKYAVLRQDVAVVGNGGCSTITFEGNGFRDLYAVDLFTERGDTIHHEYIGHESDAITSVVFEFVDAKLDNYNAIFYFTTENKRYNGVVKVEDAKEILITTTSTHSSQYLRGNTTIYTFKIENQGNMTAYRVPIYAYISCETPTGISNIKVKGLGLKKLYDYINDKDSLDNATLSDIRRICDGFSDDHYFFKFKTTEENTGDSIIVRSALFTIDLAPNSVNTITIEIQSTEKIDLWLTVPDEWHPIILNESQMARMQTKKTSWLCCYHERLECVANIVIDISDAIGVLPIPQAKIASLVSCVSGFINQTIKSYANVFCNEEKAKKSFFDKIRGVVDGISVTGSLLSCASNLLSKGSLKNLVDALSLSSDLWTGPSVIADCVNAWTVKKPGCPPDPPHGGSSNPVRSLDPNDIYGYIAESGSHAVKYGLTDVYYRIEFENDPSFATASAHEIMVTDTLDVAKFDLSTFAPTRVKIGEKSAELNGDKDFVTTIDMRPEINAIAQVEGTFDQKKGIARWHITSLDPMTMEPTDDVMQGVLPVNHNGNGIGELSYDISLKPGLAHGTEIKNRACIVFDQNEPIMTPTWTNTIDRVKPVSRVVDATVLNDSTAAISITAGDDGSGPWRYNVYVQYGSGAWFLAAENVPADTTATVKIYEGIEHHFYCVATDMAGNVEVKDAHSELTLTVREHEQGDANGDGAIDVADIATIISVMAGYDTSGSLFRSADVNGDGVVDVADISTAISIMAARARMQKAIEE